MVGTSNLGSWVMAIKMSCAPSRLIVFPLALALVVFHHLYWLHMTNLWLTMLFFFPSLCTDFIPSLGSYNQPMFAAPLSENAIPIPIFLMIFQGFFSFRIHFFVHQSWLPGWWFGTWILWLSIQLGMLSSQLTFTHIFQRGRSTTSQLYHN